jgi:hypothetical protein
VWPARQIPVAIISISRIGNILIMKEIESLKGINTAYLEAINYCCKVRFYSLIHLWTSEPWLNMRTNIHGYNRLEHAFLFEK